MNVNVQKQTPRDLPTAARMILSMIGLDHADQGTASKIGTFIRCNGYMPVWRAAANTRRHQQRQIIDDPWAYTVRLFNRNLVQLGLLYPLVHWLEGGLRSQLDLTCVIKYGPEWYRYPER